MVNSLRLLPNSSSLLSLVREALSSVVEKVSSGEMAALFDKYVCLEQTDRPTDRQIRRQPDMGTS